MATVRTPNFTNYGVLMTENDDGSLSVVIQPKDVTRNQQVVLTVPANFGAEVTSTVITRDTDLAKTNVTALVAAGALVGTFPNQLLKQANKERRAARQAEIDRLTAEQNADPALP